MTIMYLNMTVHIAIGMHLQYRDSIKVMIYIRGHYSTPFKATVKSIP